MASPSACSPIAARSAQATHELEVKADGYSAKRQAIVISLEPTTTARIELELPPERPTTHARTDQPPPLATDYVAEDPARKPTDEASPWNIIVGGLLAAGGVAIATIEPIQTISKDGDCANDACTATYTVGGETALKIGAGALLAAAGVTLMIWQPLRIEAHATPDRAVVQGQLTF